MRLDPRWIVLDLAGPDDGDLMVHSIGGVPCERTLRRAIKVCDLQLDREGSELLSKYVRELDRSQHDFQVQTGGLHIAHHVVEHPAHGPLAVAVWMHPDPPAPRAVLNTWVLYLDDLTTVTAGDDVTILGDGREEGEERPIQDLWRFLNPADAAELVTRYREAVVGPDRSWMGIEWSLALPDAEPLHLYSGGRLRVDGDHRMIVGTSVVLEERTAKPPDLLGPLVAFAGITLAVVNREAQSAVTSVGADAPLSYEALRKLVTAHDLYSSETFTVELDDRNYSAQVVPLASPTGGAATVMLRRQENG